MEDNQGTVDDPGKVVTLVSPEPRAVSDGVVDVRGVYHEYALQDEKPQPVLVDLTLALPPGEFVAIVGPSGCGKTTLLNLLAGLDKQKAGTIAVLGQPPRAGDTRVGYLFSRDALLPWRTAQKNVELALQLVGVRKKDRAERAVRALSEMGLNDYAGALPSQLSQGMRQRVAIARTLVTEPQLVLMDEPFSALDAQTRILVQDEFLKMWGRRGITVVLITHDLSEAIALADRVVLMGRRPSQIKAEFPITLSRPRSTKALQSEREYHAIYEAIWKVLEDEFVSN